MGERDKPLFATKRKMRFIFMHKREKNLIGKKKMSSFRHLPGDEKAISSASELPVLFPYDKERKFTSPILRHPDFGYDYVEEPLFLLNDHYYTRERTADVFLAFLP